MFTMYFQNYSWFCRYKQKQEKYTEAAVKEDRNSDRTDMHHKLDSSMGQMNRNINNNNNNNQLTIEVIDLYRLLTNRNVGLLMMDCRPKIQFKECHIDYDFCMNIPEEIIKKG